MFDSRPHLFILVFLLALAAQLLIGTTPLAAQGGCKVIFDASNKVLNTPAHLYSTTNIGGKPQTVESIYAGGTIYIKFNGKWSPSPITMQETKELAQKNEKTNKVTCQYLNDELVNGDMAAVYNVHEETPAGKVDSKIWISKAKGLLLREEIDLDKIHSSTRYEYGNVKPPA